MDMINVMYDNGIELNFEHNWESVKKLITERNEDGTKKSPKLRSQIHWYRFGDTIIYIDRILWIRKVK